MPTTTTTNRTLVSFVADPGSVVRYGAGRQINWDLVTETIGNSKIVYAGTVMSLTDGLETIFPRAEQTVAAEPAACIMVDTVVEGGPGTSGPGHVGVYIGGVFYEDLMPDATGSPRALVAAYKTELEATGGFFVWQSFD